MLIGTRQTGKTYILDEFCAKNFENYIYINLEREADIVSIFDKTLDPDKIVENIEIIKNVVINPLNTVIFFDEIQVSERAISSLKYFCESNKPYKVVFAIKKNWFSVIF